MKYISEAMVIGWAITLAGGVWFGVWILTKLIAHMQPVVETLPL